MFLGATLCCQSDRVRDTENFVAMGAIVPKSCHYFSLRFQVDSGLIFFPAPGTMRDGISLGVPKGLLERHPCGPVSASQSVPDFFPQGSRSPRKGEKRHHTKRDSSLRSERRVGVRSGGKKGQREEDVHRQECPLGLCRRPRKPALFPANSAGTQEAHKRRESRGATKAREIPRPDGNRNSQTTHVSGAPRPR